MQEVADVVDFVTSLATTTSARSQIATHDFEQRREAHVSRDTDFIDGDTDLFEQSNPKVVNCAPSVRLQFVIVQESV